MARFLGNFAEGCKQTTEGGCEDEVLQQRAVLTAAVLREATT